ncbi:hypothetical protein SBOR_3726 [Sclerotinia borealis F-4128]|uniref:C6 zinc finger domain containing protein n=1 Tax=Sclerotinia borealis (strain F-4128) TaxID=1432307 RepID=W9CIU9_SCLBF|nr:hypothetical protein SBOR_3726 [Sclerotinia borealis F-4128]
MASPQTQTHHTPSSNTPTSPTSPLGLTHDDPFAAQRKDPINSNPFASKTQGPINIPTPTSPNATSNTHSGSPNQDRRLSSDEWDASKTPPSRFQKRKGSIYATPSSRDGHVDKHIDRDAVFHATHAEKGYGSIFGLGAHRNKDGGGNQGGRRVSKSE